MSRKSALLPSAPILDRINRLLEKRPDIKRIPVHPTDYDEAKVLYAMGAWGAVPAWTLSRLGDKS
jgi:hypothetical protein